jgi:hypothetical protein
MEWSAIHQQGVSWRKQIVGEISDAFTIPRYVRLFCDTFGDLRGASFFEVGSGNGDIPAAILAANQGQISRYLTSEFFPEGVKWLQGRGLDAVQGDAERLDLANASFDGVIAFDVMHHVENPRAMAGEMMRVSRGRCLLVEANGLSVFRKLKEMAPGHRKAGERSYLPRRYRGFFQGHGYELIRFDVKPFLFAFKVPPRLLALLVRFNEWIERVPVLRWQCASLAIRVEYRRP